MSCRAVQNDMSFLADDYQQQETTRETVDGDHSAMAGRISYASCHCVVVYPRDCLTTLCMSCSATRPYSGSLETHCGDHPLQKPGFLQQILLSNPSLAPWDTSKAVMLREAPGQNSRAEFQGSGIGQDKIRCFHLDTLLEAGGSNLSVGERSLHLTGKGIGQILSHYLGR